MDTSGPTIHLHIICLTVNTVVVLVVLMVILVVGWSGVAVTFGQFRHRKFCSSSKTSSIDINGASARFSHHFAAKLGKKTLPPLPFHPRPPISSCNANTVNGLDSIFPRRRVCGPCNNSVYRWRNGCVGLLPIRPLPHPLGRVSLLAG